MAGESDEMHHISEELLEYYSLQQLSEDRLAPLEEHLLVCESCQKRLTQVDNYVAAMKIAAREITADSPPRAPRVPRRPLQWALSLSGGVVLATLLVFAFVGRPVSTLESEVTLTATRGGTPGSLTQVPAHAVLLVKADIADDAAGPLDLELVSEQGKTLWHGTAEARQGQIAARVSRPLDAGLYWFRVYEKGQLLREYGLQVK
jgi:hypothetical protein